MAPALAVKQFPHAVVLSPDHDERAREEFVCALRGRVLSGLVPAVAEVWTQRVRDSIDGEPESRAQVRAAMLADPFIQMTFSLRRIAQEQLWDAVSQVVERELDDLNARAVVDEPAAGGTLDLDSSLQPPGYLTALDIHAMPTGYWDVATDGYDVAAGAIFDRGDFLYSLGRSGPLGDSRGRSIVESFFLGELAGFAPRRILDLGCSVGHSLLPYCDAYPQAEVWGIDVAPGMLRYAHARAESLGRRVHYSQQNAEHTRFPDGHFDLVVSHILLHETSRTALGNIFRECHRLLAPGGFMMHAEVPQFHGVDTFTQFMLDYDTFYNNEPFWGAMHDIDLLDLAVDVGFERSKVRTAYAASGRSETADRTGRAAPKGAPVRQLQLTVAQR